jgi:hypothetical protein
MRYPNFLGVGAGKTGTSWLHACLEEHPEVRVSLKKEVNYFSDHYGLGERWYLAQFPEVGAAKAVGELSPSYMIDPAVPERIAAFHPDMLLLFMFRDPVDRAYSHYCMNLRLGVLSDDVDRELVPGTRFVDEGDYVRHLAAFDRFFPDHQLFLSLYDDLKEDPADYWRKTLVFLGVDPSVVPSLVQQAYHVRKPRPRSVRLFRAVVASARYLTNRSRHARQLLDVARRRGVVDWFHRANQGPEFPPLPKHTARRLAEHYAPGVEALGARLGRDLSGWTTRHLDGR